MWKVILICVALTSAQSTFGEGKSLWPFFLNIYANTISYGVDGSGVRGANEIRQFVCNCDGEQLNALPNGAQPITAIITTERHAQQHRNRQIRLIKCFIYLSLWHNYSHVSYVRFSLCVRGSIFPVVCVFRSWSVSHQHARVYMQKTKSRSSSMNGTRDNNNKKKCSQKLESYNCEL